MRWRIDRIFRCLHDVGCYLTWVSSAAGSRLDGSARCSRLGSATCHCGAMTPGTCVPRWADLGSCIVGEPGRPAAEGGQMLAHNFKSFG